VRIYLAHLNQSDDDLMPLRGVNVRTPWGLAAVVHIRAREGKAVVMLDTFGAAPMGMVHAGHTVAVRVHTQRRRYGTLARWNRRGWMVVSEETAFRFLPPDRLK
jgi:hypothetical protein